MQQGFRVGMTRTLRSSSGGGRSLGRIGLEALENELGIETFFLKRYRRVLGHDDVDGLDALIIENATLPAEAVTNSEQLVLVARFGAGYDAVDVDACTREGILVTNAPDGVRRPMASAYLALILALTLRLVEKDRLMRKGRWTEAHALWGVGLCGRTLGVVGLGSIGTELLRLARPLQMRYLASGPRLTPQALRSAGARAVPLATLLAELDVVCIAVPLTTETRGLIGAAELGSMKPTAFLINASRGPVVDQQALIAALRSGQIRGAGLDVFAVEPVRAGDELLALDNVILTPHSLGHTDELLLLTGRSVASSILEVARGKRPRHLVNPDVLASPRLRARIAVNRRSRSEGPIPAQAAAERQSHSESLTPRRTGPESRQ